MGIYRRHSALSKSVLSKAVLFVCGALITGCTTFSPNAITSSTQPHEDAPAENLSLTHDTKAAISQPLADVKPPQQQPQQLEDRQFDLPVTMASPRSQRSTQKPDPQTQTAHLDYLDYDPADEGDYEPIDFLGICEGVQAGFGYNGEETLRALLNEVETEDCELAQARLLTITDLRLSGPEMPETVITCLLINLPTYVDIGTIAAAMPNLTRLELSDRIIDDLTPIRDLTQLTELHLSNTQISDISPIAHLTKLTTLDISHNQVHDISPISNLANLQHINLAANPVRDISPLAVLPREGASFNLNDVPFDLKTCPDTLTDTCEHPSVGY